MNLRERLRLAPRAPKLASHLVPRLLTTCWPNSSSS